MSASRCRRQQCLQRWVADQKSWSDSLGSAVDWANATESVTERCDIAALLVLGVIGTGVAYVMNDRIITDDGPWKRWRGSSDSGTNVTELVYRHQIRPAIETGATVMDRLFGKGGSGA